MKSEPEVMACVLRDPADLEHNESYYGPMLKALQKELIDHGVRLDWVQCRHDYQQSEFLRTAGNRYTGVAFTGDMFNQKPFIQEVARKMPGPKVIVDHHFDDVPIHSVREDAVGGMRVLTEHLLGLGHRRFAYLDNPDLNANPWKRLGVNLALRSAGLKPLNRDLVAGCRTDEEDAGSALEWFREQSPPPTAVICCDDGRAMALAAAARKLGLSIPADLSVAGYGDAAATSGKSSVLTSMRVDTNAMGRRAADLLLGHPHASPTAALVTPELKARESTASPAQEAAS